MTSCSSEFDLIAKYFAPLATSPNAFALKDDAALVPQRAGHDIVVTTDTVVAGIDFFEDDPPDTIAKKALRVNLSDLAAKGAEPAAYLLSLSLSPASADEAWLGMFARGLGDDQAHYGVTLLGGDMSGTPGPLSVAITAFGHVPAGRMIRRDGARAGDFVYVTGTIGDSGGGLAARQGPLFERYRVPDPPVALGRKLIGIASAAIDVSDGLIADLGHIAQTSGARIVVEADRVPRSDALRALWGNDVLRAVTAGDDYQIAFTSSAPDAPAACIGRVEKGAGVVLLDARGQEIAVPVKGFTHF
ncbi:MAG: thiamine-phosphate kinase [Alphaproteobacteria bacterium]|nr:thiamine-phosphate kinase [Alphaproteobacteria bacterium]